MGFIQGHVFAQGTLHVAQSYLQGVDVVQLRQQVGQVGCDCVPGRIDDGVVEENDGAVLLPNNQQRLERIWKSEATPWLLLRGCRSAGSPSCPSTSKLVEQRTTPPRGRRDGAVANYLSGGFGDSNGKDDEIHAAAL